MNHTLVKSSNLTSVAYDAGSHTLEVKFASGAIWRYSGVPASEHAALMKAASIGGYFASNIRGKYPAKAVA